MPSSAVLARAAEVLGDDALPLGVFDDAATFELEKERIFGRTWQFLAHESEVPEPGDFVTRYIVDDSFLVVRGDDGQVRVLLNACRHRGRQLCRAEQGRAANFTCPYHGWVFGRDGALTEVPRGDEIYAPGTLDRSRWGLVPAPKVGIWRGWIFANLDPDAEPLEDYLGDARWYLEFYTDKTPGGLEVRGAPQRWVIDADWKLGADNFIGDGYHTFITHASTLSAGMLPAGDAEFLFRGVQVAMEHFGVGFARQDPLFNTLAYPPPMIESLKARLTPEQRRLLEMGVSLPTHGTLFPNLSFLNAPAAATAKAPPAPYFTLRVWRPLGPGRMEVWSWFLVERDAPEDFKQASYRGYLLSFGASGCLEQDDAENWLTISAAARGTFGKRMLLNYAMGDGLHQPIADWPGPGPAYPEDYAEFGQRAFWRKWLAMMQG